MNGRLIKPAATESNPKKIRLVREAWWLVLVTTGIFLALILFTYHRDDPSWSHSASDSAIIHNAGGALGAWFSDILLYLFGFSAWWLVVLSFYAMWLVYLKLEAATHEQPMLIINIAGFGMLLLASATLEAGHFLSLPADLPLSPARGGLIGTVFDGFLQGLLGFAGSTLTLLLLFAVGFSLFTGWSWIMVTEKLGAGLEWLYFTAIEKWHDWQDRKAGKLAEQMRSEFVESERKRTEDRPPVEIVTPALDIPKSERVQKERQVSLFEGMPDTALPPLHLLDEAKGEIEV
ncbi:MAG: DNA translocase FtsK 4TM domain-containing protein, partial [Methylophilaceae bacterium]|nr:DNA translocase FtsK 4TM domain-containing protein [Methylophilaceae bacterium]